MRYLCPFSCVSAATAPTIGRVRRQPELRMDVGGRFDLHAMEIDSLVNGDDAIGVDAVADEHLADGIRRGDEAIDLVILPAREGVPFQVECDTPGRDEHRDISRSS